MTNFSTAYKVHAMIILLPLLIASALGDDARVFCTEQASNLCYADSSKYTTILRHGSDLLYGLHYISTELSNGMERMKS